MGKHLKQALPSVYTLQYLTCKEDNKMKPFSHIHTSLTVFYCLVQPHAQSYGFY